VCALDAPRSSGAIPLLPITGATAANGGAKYLILLGGGPGRRERQLQGISRTTVANCRQSVRSRLTGTVTGPVELRVGPTLPSRGETCVAPLVHPRSNFVKRTRPEKTKKKIPGKCALSLLQNATGRSPSRESAFAPKSDKSLGRSEMTRWAQQQTSRTALLRADSKQKTASAKRIL